MTTEEQEVSPWETEVGLPNDFDGWITNSRFGVRDEYQAKVSESGGGEVLMFLMDLVDENNEAIGTQGFSVGTGWVVSEDKLEISHAKRRNVVNSSRYGQLQNRVRKELGVKMEERGSPLQAKSWDGLGFHWLMQEHEVLDGTQKMGLMPVSLLGERKPGAAAPTPAKAAPSSELELKLKEIAQQNDVKAFQKLALKMPEVVAVDELMASVLDEGATGFWATHQ